MINDNLDKLNEHDYDPCMIDRTLEFGEALGDLSRHPEVITTSRTDDNEYMMQRYKEFLKENVENPEPRAL